MNTHSYHLRRELAEMTMSVEADSAVARIVHDKLAILHRSSAARAAAAVIRAAKGETPVVRPVEL